jgi:hypothetical protein
VPCFESISKVVEYNEFNASMPTHRWKQVAVSWPSFLCILFWLTKSTAFSAICKNLFTLMPVREDCAEAVSGSSVAISYVSATALIEGRING